MKYNSVRWLVLLALVQAVFSFNCGQNQTLTIVPFNDTNAISVSASPSTSVLVAGQTLQLTASVTGTDKKDVAWTIFSSSVDTGTIDASGLYKAPRTAVLGAVRIQAASVANPTKTAVATVWVLAPGTVSTTNNPLVARYSIPVPAGANFKVEFGPDTSYGLVTWTQPAPSGGGQMNMLVAGMRASSTYHMRADIELPGGAQFQDTDHSFQTGALPAGRIPQIAVSTQGTLMPNPGVELMALNKTLLTTNPLMVVVTDLQGNIIWYYDLDPTGTNGETPLPIKLMANGDMLVSATPITPAGGSLPGVLREIDLAGNTIREMSVSELTNRLAAAGYSNVTVNAIHHDFALLPNGHIILLADHTKDFTDLPGYPGTTTVFGDVLVDIDKDWNPVWVWDTFDHLDVNRHPRGLPDWTHGNSVIYSADDGNLLFSSRHQSWVIKIDYEDGKGNGAVLWKFGYQGDFTLDSGVPAAWQYGQHDLHILSPNSVGSFTLGLFDNGYVRVLDDTGALCGTTGQPACYTRVPLFRVDEATRTAHVLWEASPLPYSAAVGSIELLDNGDLEFDEGFLPANPFDSHVLEVTQETIPQAVWELDVIGQVGYRIYRIPSLYPGVQW
ncbi:MAG TPA: aryl-sulfate sulfotransferase [Terriglobia bacterium]|nr:aryl-sulfate sulfotransferase [Terriglobia bacterium]